MFPSVRAVSFRATFSFVLAFATGVIAQTAIDDVHVTPRERTVDVATAGYASARAGDYVGGAVIRTGASLVLVPVSITDDRNRPVVGLNQQNFQLFENKKPQPIKNFSSEDSPVSIGILVDTSGSMSYKLERARDAVEQFCEAANPQDEFFMITFADVPYLATDFTTSPENLENGLLTARSKGQTSLLDAIYMGIDKLRSAHYTRKALLILSDGGDNHSRYSERDVKSAIKEADITIYAVGIYERYVDSQEELRGPELLRTITELSGGDAFTLTNPNELATMTRNIGTRLRHQYVLAYEPQSTARDGKWHKISVKLRLPRKLLTLHVRARAGFYASGE